MDIKGKSAVVVGVSECRVCQDPERYIVTYGLGSCIAVAVYDPKVRVGGLLHFQLPDSSADPEMAESHPAMYADTGMQLLINKLTRVGVDPKKAITRIAGGAQMFSDSLLGSASVRSATGTSSQSGPGIGKQNYMAVRKLLWRFGLLLEGEAVGGAVSRTFGLTLSSGEFWVKSGEGVEHALSLEDQRRKQLAH